MFTVILFILLSNRDTRGKNVADITSSELWVFSAARRRGPSDIYSNG